MTTPVIRGYGIDWHVQGRSAAFDDLLIDPLRPYCNVQIAPLPQQGSIPLPGSGEPLIFCQAIPPAYLFDSPNPRIVWIPMWDQMRGYSQRWWNALPKSLRVVAYSRVVEQRARRAGLPVLRLTYYKDPDALPPARWDDERVLFYWNRIGMLEPALLERLCAELRIDRLLFKPEIDPFIPAAAAFTLPDRLGQTVVEPIPTVASREQHWQLIERASFYIAPRLYEGAGMTFLEALARGCAVLAHRGPTMSEYMTHGQDGYFFARRWTAGRVRHAAHSKLALHRLLRQPAFRYPLFAREQPWDALRQMDWPAIGAEARRRHQLGFRQWQAQIPELARFILDG